MRIVSKAAKATVMSGLLGLPAGLVWLLWTEPAMWLMTERGLVMTEDLAAGQFNSVATFSLIGAVVGTLVGIVVVFVVGVRTWHTVWPAVGGAVLASGLCWLLGIIFGPNDPTAETTVGLGERVPAQLVVDTPASFAVWPLCAAIVVFVSFYLAEGTRAPATESEPVQPERA